MSVASITPAAAPEHPASSPTLRPGVQYLFVADCFGYAGMGGMTVLVDADGKPLISEEADHD